MKFALGLVVGMVAAFVIGYLLAAKYLARALS